MQVKGCEECETRMNCSHHSTQFRNFEAKSEAARANLAYCAGYDEGQALGLHNRATGKEPDAERARCPRAMASHYNNYYLGFAAGWKSAFDEETG